MTNKAELIDVVAEATGTSKAAAGEALDAVIAAITNALKGGEEVRLVGFGTFSVKRAAGKGRNPATGTEIDIPASKSVRFKPGAQLKTTVNRKRLQRTSCVGGPRAPRRLPVATGAISVRRPSASPDLFGLRGIYVCEAVLASAERLPACQPRRAL